MNDVAEEREIGELLEDHTLEIELADQQRRQPNLRRSDDLSRQRRAIWETPPGGCGAGSLNGAIMRGVDC